MYFTSKLGSITFMFLTDLPKRISHREIKLKLLLRTFIFVPAFAFICGCYVIIHYTLILSSQVKVNAIIKQRVVAGWAFNILTLINSVTCRESQEAMSIKVILW